MGDIRTGRAELYDLDADPRELRNLAGTEVSRVSEYAAQCEEWFVKSDAEYIARVKGYHPQGGRTLQPDDYREAGPKLQSAGFDGPGGTFVESSNIAAGTRPVVWTSWVNDGKPRHPRWQWTSPSGEESWTELDLENDWISSYTRYRGKLPMEPGTWTTRLLAEGKSGLVSRFKVLGGR